MERRSDDLFERYYKSWRGIETAYDKIAAMHGVTYNIMNVLTLLYKRRAPMTQNDLSRELNLSRQTVTSVVDSLEKRELVTRSIAEGDRRSRVISLTEQGRASGREIGRAMRRIELSAFESLSETDQSAFVDNMEKLWHGLAHALGDEYPNSSTGNPAARFQRAAGFCFRSIVYSIRAVQKLRTAPPVSASISRNANRPPPSRQICVRTGRSGSIAAVKRTDSVRIASGRPGHTARISARQAKPAVHMPIRMGRSKPPSAANAGSMCRMFGSLSMRYSAA